MKKLNLLLILVCVLVAVGCRQELITGPIRGIFKSYDYNNNALADNSGIEIKLIHDSLEAGISVTDAAGWFNFDDVPYGRYSVTYTREGYIRPYSIPLLNHAGGGVPLYMNYSIYEVPSFTIDLDSVSPGRYSEKIIYLRIDGDTILPAGEKIVPYGYASHFILFASESPDVSASNFKARAKGFMIHREPYHSLKPVAVKGKVTDVEDISFTFSETDSIYLRAYPLAGGQGYHFSSYLPGALGKPSNVIRCIWPE